MGRRRILWTLGWWVALAGTAVAQTPGRGRTPRAGAGTPAPPAIQHEFSVGPEMLIGGHLRLSRKVDHGNLLPPAPVRIDGKTANGARVRYRRIQPLGHGWSILTGPDFGYRWLYKAAAEWHDAGVREALNFDANDTSLTMNLGTQFSAWNGRFTFRGEVGLGVLFSIVDVFYESDIPPPFSDALDGRGDAFALVPLVRTGVTVGYTLPDFGLSRPRFGVQCFAGYVQAGTVAVDMDNTITSLNGAFTVDFGRVYYRPSGWLISVAATIAF